MGAHTGHPCPSEPLQDELQAGSAVPPPRSAEEEGERQQVLAPAPACLGVRREGWGTGKMTWGADWAQTPALPLADRSCGPGKLRAPFPSSVKQAPTSVTLLLCPKLPHNLGARAVSNHAVALVASVHQDLRSGFTRQFCSVSLLRPGLGDLLPRRPTCFCGRPQLTPTWAPSKGRPPALEQPLPPEQVTRERTSEQEAAAPFMTSPWRSRSFTCTARPRSPRSAPFGAGAGGPHRT